AVLDVLVDHGIAADFQHVAATTSRDQLIGYGDGIVPADGLDRLARRDETKQGQLGGPSLTLGRYDFDRAALVMRPADVPFSLQIGEVLMDCGERVEAELAGDLLEAGGVPLGIEVARDKVEDFALAARDWH